MKLRTRIRIMQGPRTTVAELRCIDEKGTSAVFTGDSKKHPNDVDDHLTGAYYAISRAFHEAGDYFEQGAEVRLAKAGDLDVDMEGWAWSA